MALSQQFIMDLFSDINVCFSHQSLSTKELISRKINKHLGKTKYLFGFFTQPWQLISCNTPKTPQTSSSSCPAEPTFARPRQ